MSKTAMQFKVYFLPKANYCGVTGRNIEKRLWEHQYYFGRNTTGVEILATFDTKRDALDFEAKYQIDNKVNGYGYDDNWRKDSSERLLKNGEKWIYSKRRKPIVCIETGQIFGGVRDCANKFNSNSGNLSAHLKGRHGHNTFCKLKFKYL